MNYARCSYSAVYVQSSEEAAREVYKLRIFSNEPFILSVNLDYNNQSLGMYIMEQQRQKYVHVKIHF